MLGRLSGRVVGRAPRFPKAAAACRLLSTSRPLFDESVKVSVNGAEYDVPKGCTVLQACEVAGIHIPRFCYHDRLSIAGNCRMCLVEVEKTPKPVASCAFPVMPNMKIKTDTPMVKRAREGVMEFLLANHPLDCPICDQGGECDLQDQAVAFGNSTSRFRELKRVVEDKYLGPLIKTIMTRCIHCTRCIRFAKEIAGVPDMGTTGRGAGMEIGTYIGKKFDSELSGNAIDLCPVGALTSKPYAFVARPWELVGVESVDVMDAVGSAIRVDVRGPEIMRILPRLNEDVNEEWISDKTRFSYDGLKRQRLDSPLIRVNGEIVEASWQKAFSVIRQKAASVKGNEMLAIAGDLAEAESLVALKDLFNRMGSGNLELNDAIPLNADVRSNYLFNSTIAGIEEADVLVLIGSNPRMEAPLIAARMRKAVRAGGLRVFNVGPEADLAMPHTHIANKASVLADLAKGKGELANILKSAKKPMVVLGMGALTAKNGQSVLSAVQSLPKAFPTLKSDAWNGINILHTAASNAAALDIGFVQGVSKPVAQPKFVYLLNADDYDDARIPADAFVVYQGHHGDKGANRADVVLPASAFTEDSMTFVNTEGRVQRTNAALQPVTLAREGWQIIRALSEVLGYTLPYSEQDAVRARLAEIAPHFAQLEQTPTASFTETFVAPAEKEVPLDDTPFNPFFDNFFMTNAIARSSSVMAKASRDLPVSRNNYATQ